MALWTPTNLTDGSLELWFDANNAGSIVLSGSNVTSWTDLANGVSMAQDLTAPTYSASLLNSLPGIIFASGGFNNTSTTFGAFTNPLSVFSVLNVTTAGIWNPVFIASTGGNGLDFAFNGTPPTMYTQNYGSGGNASTQTLAINTPAIAEWVAPGLSGGSWGPVQPYINGTAGGSISALTGVSFTQSGIAIGINPFSDEFVGHIHEIVILHTQASTTDRQLIEGYLAWKWGLQAGLPGGHPYASAAPTTGAPLPPQGPPRPIAWAYGP